MTFIAQVHNLEVRGIEIKSGKNGDYAVIKFDDERGERLEFIDRDSQNFDFYKRGKICDVWISVTNTKEYTNFKITKLNEIVA